MIEVKFYNNSILDKWNDFLIESKGQTFMFNRNFMDYHSDRFVDRSLIVYEDNQIVAIMPACLHKDENSIVSHSGLTYGSFVVKEALRSYKTILYLYHTIKFLFENDIKFLEFKQIPEFYSDISIDEVDYTFFILEAEVHRMDVAYCINYDKTIQYQERRIRSIKKGQKNNIKVERDSSFSNFWNQILIPNLNERFGVNPVHSLQEITDLSLKNKDSIIQYNAYLGNDIMAGTTLFVTPNVIHAQYISASDEGRKNGSLDYLFDFLIKKYSNSKKYFDFGIVNEDSGKSLNFGLLDWKEGFGARAFAHRFYKISTQNYINLEKLLKV